MPRFEPVASTVESPEVQDVFDRIRARGEQPSPLYLTLAHAPALLAAWAGFAGALRHSTALERSVAELVVMRLAQLSEAPYQWAYHWKPALAAGLTEDQLRSLGHWRESTGFDLRQRLALGLAEDMFRRAVDDEQVLSLRTEFDTGQLFELILTIGFYINVGRVLQVLDLDVDPSLRPYLP